MTPAERHLRALEALQLDSDPDCRAALIRCLIAESERLVKDAGTAAAFVSGDLTRNEVRTALRVADVAAHLIGPEPREFWDGPQGQELAHLAGDVLAAVVAPEALLAGAA